MDKLDIFYLQLMPMIIVIGVAIKFYHEQKEIRENILKQAETAEKQLIIAEEKSEKELKSQTGVTLPKENVGKVNTSIGQDTNDMLFTTKKVISSTPIKMLVLILVGCLIKKRHR